jgi:NB-ARC domain
MVSSVQTNERVDDLIALVEDCLNNYACDAHLFQSPLATWEVVKSRLPAVVTTTPEQLAVTVRAVLDDLIDALRPPESVDLNSPSVRRYIIADQLYRRGIKQTEICQSQLPISKSQFYRERTETLITLANGIQQWEERAVEYRKLRAIKTLAMSSPGGDTRLIGVDSLLAQLTQVLTAADSPNLIMLSGPAGLGKTAVAQAAVEHLLDADQFHTLVWINNQRHRFTGTHIQAIDTPVLTIDDLFSHLVRQLRPGAVSDERLFDVIAQEHQDGKATFDQVLSFLNEELDAQEPSDLPLAEKMSLVMDLLWSTPTLIVVDGLEVMPHAERLIDDLRQITSRTKVLITSRNRYSECDYVQRIDMAALGESDAVRLIQKHGAERAIKAIEQAPAHDLRTLASVACGNPLVIKWLVNQLASLPVGQVLADLAQAASLSSELYKFLYRAAWDSLSEPARQVLVAIAQSPASAASWESLQRATGWKPEVLNRSLKELVAASLVPVSESLEPSYRVSPLTRAFVLAVCHETPSSRKNAIRCLPRKTSAG